MPISGTTLSDTFLYTLVNQMLYNPKLLHELIKRSTLRIIDSTDELWNRLNGLLKNLLGYLLYSGKAEYRPFSDFSLIIRSTYITKICLLLGFLLELLFEAAYTWVRERE